MTAGTCSINRYSEYEMFRTIYPSGAGFGVLPITDGAHKFKSAILGALSSALLSLIAPSPQAAALQTFDGITLSSVITTLNASARESLDSAAALLRGPSAAEAAERSAAVRAAEERVAALEAELEAADAAEAEEEEPPPLEEAAAESAEEAVAPAEAAAEATPAAEAAAAEAAAAKAMVRDELAAAVADLEVAKKAPPRPAARGDAARLRAALEADELRPVRLALGLPLPTEALAIEAASSLIRAGVCVSQLEEKGYPEPFIKAMRAAGAAMMKRL